MLGLRRHRWVLIICGVIAVVLVGGSIATSFIVGRIFRQKLAVAVHERMNAELITGAVHYWPPYSFHAGDVRIVRPGRDGKPAELFSADALRLKLSHFPHKGESTPPLDQLVLKRAILGDRAGGQSVDLGNVRLSAHPGSEPDVLNWRVMLLDHHAAGGEAEGVLDRQRDQLEVTKIAISSRLGKLLSLLPLSKKQWQEVVGTAPDGQFAMSGSGTIPLKHTGQARFRVVLDLTDATAEVDKWKSKFERGSGRIVVHDAGATDQRLPKIEADIDHIHFLAGSGKLRLDGGHFTITPDQGWKLAQVVGSVEMGKALPFSPPRSGWFFNQGKFGGVVEFTLAASGPMRFPKNSSAFELIQHDLLAYPHDVAIQPAKFPLPVEHVSGGPITFHGGVISFQNLTGTYGGDALMLRTARLTLEDPVRKIKLDDLKSQVKFEEIAGTIIFKQQPNPRYPRVIGKTVAALRPHGPFIIGGGSWYAINRPQPNDARRKLKTDSFIRLIGDGGSFTVTNKLIPLTDIQGEATLTPMSINIQRFDSKSLGGRAWASGQIAPGQVDEKRPFLYRGRAELRHIDLSELGKLLAMKDSGRVKFSGFGACSLDIAGVGGPTGKAALDSFTADGEVQVIRGDFGSLPAVQDVAQNVKRTNQLGTGDAAAVVRVANRVINIQNAAVNSSLLGIQGIGTIGFDKSLDLTLVAAPLGDWRDKMRQAGIPVVGDVLGAVQQLFNTAQGVLLYQFKVTGTTSKPVVNLVPAPALTQPLALLFGQMLRQDQNGNLLNDVKGQPAQSSPEAQPASAKQRGR